VLGGLILGCDL